jgi:Putative Ig domain
VTARDDSLIKIVPPDSSQLTATVPVQYRLDLTAIGASTPFTWSVVSGDLPEGLTLDPLAGTVKGTPLQFGTYSVAIKVEDSSPAPIETTLSVTFAVNSGLQLLQNLINPVLGAPFSESLAPSTTGGLPQYTWQLTQGKRPTVVFEE